MAGAKKQTGRVTESYRGKRNFCITERKSTVLDERCFNKYLVNQKNYLSLILFYFFESCYNFVLKKSVEYFPYLLQS